MPNDQSKTEGAADVRVRPLVSCSICGTETDPDEIKHLPIYANGSEGVETCMTCRQILTDVARGMIRASIAGRKQGYLAAKKVMAAKAANEKVQI